MKGISFLIFSFSINLLASMPLEQRGYSVKIDSRKYFIENKGQFRFEEGDGLRDSILYAYIGAKEKYYFTKNGVITVWNERKQRNNPAVFFQKTFSSKEKREEMEREGEFTENKRYIIQATWNNSSTYTQVIPDQKENHYYTFSNHKERTNAYNRIVYKDIYPNIDIAYIIPKDSSGIKYDIILHSGADLSLVDLTYTGDIKSIIQNDEGDIIISSTSEKIKFTEKRPISFLAKNNSRINSSFRLQNKNHIVFDLSLYPISETVVIDPWVSPIVASEDNIGYDVDFDLEGNLYTYVTGMSGGDFISKYSSEGDFLWSHIHDFPGASIFDGNFVVEKNTGRVYICEPVNFNDGAMVYRVTSAGIQDSFSTVRNPLIQEFWDLGFNCIDGSLVVFGGSTNSNLNGGAIDTASGLVAAANFTGFFSEYQDVVSYVFDKQGRLFTLFSSGVNPQVNNHLIRVNNTLNGFVYNVSTGYQTFDESRNHLGFGFPNSGNQFNALAANDDYLIYYDGGNLRAFDPNTGSSLGSIIVNGHTPLEQGGVVIDNCNNVYIGGNDGNILYYNFDGSTFNFVGNLDLNWTGTQKNVHDIAYDQSTQQLFISGRMNVGVYALPVECSSFSLITSGNCSTPENGQLVTVVSSLIGDSDIEYIWTDTTGNILKSGISSLLSDTINGLNSGTYFVQVQMDPYCGGPVLKDSVTIECSDFSIFIPNSFTPNNDGLNDLFLVKGNGIASLNVKIFDRWGDQIFEIEDLSEGWDGDYDDTKLISKSMTSIFPYMLKATFENGKEIIKQGHIHLVK